MSARSMMSRRARLALLALPMVLTACSSEMGELQEWMEQQRREVRPSIKPLVPPTKFLPEAYIAEPLVEPFSTEKLSVAVRQDAGKTSALLKAETARRREPLEAYPLDSMRMVGSITRQGRRYALLRVVDLLHQVKVGDYMGENFGRVTQITETEVSLREVVQDAAGEWVERVNTLTLRETD